MHDEEWFAFTMDELDDLHSEVKKMEELTVAYSTYDKK